MNFTGTRTFLHLSVLGVAVVLAGCSNTSKNKVSFLPAKDAESKSGSGLIAKITNSNEVENTGSAGQNFASVPTTSDQTKFSSKSYGVKGSPRVTKSKRVKKGGGRYQVGKAYTIRGKRYVPREDPNYRAVGLASWYGPNFHGRLTANGEVYDQYSLSAAHPTMPLPSYAKVTNLENGASVTVRVNDRGPFAHNRVIDLSSRAAQLLGYTKKGVAKVKVEYVGKARMDGLDEKQLVASYNPGKLDPRSIPPNPGGQVLLAQAEKPRRANTARTILSSFDDRSVEAPVPLSRPADQASGFPIELSKIFAPRPTSLVNGYVPDQQNAAHNALEQFELTETTAGMAGLDRIKIGPISPTHANDVAEKLSGFGPVNELDGPTDEQSFLIVTYDITDKRKLLDFVVANSLLVASHR